jgi:phage recombination protein Bet
MRRWRTMDTIAKRMRLKREGIHMADRLALATVTNPNVPAVTPDQYKVIKETIAKDATPAELDLFLYDNARQGVHPLDRLIHFTKRGGRYTPITSIDFMRMRAGDSGECAGSDDAIFQGAPRTTDFAATVTVYRLVQGQRCAFTATARWNEYKPEQDFMWNKMPHVMLSKCAEALALRKGFPKQLSGLYIKEEMEQAAASPVLPRRALPGPAAPSLVGDAAAVPAAEAAPADAPLPLPEAWQPFAPITGTIAHVTTEEKPGRRSGKVHTKTTVIMDSGEELYTLAVDLGAKAIAFKETGDRVTITTFPSPLGREIQSMVIANDAAF